MIALSISRGYRWKVQGRLAVLEYAAVHGLKPAAARFGLDRKTVRQWRDRAREAGAPSLIQMRRRPRAAWRGLEASECSTTPSLFEVPYLTTKNRMCGMIPRRRTTASTSAKS